MRVDIYLLCLFLKRLSILQGQGGLRESVSLPISLREGSNRVKEDSSFLGAVALYHFTLLLERKCETVVLKGTWGQSNQISHLPFLSGGAEEEYDIRISSPRRLQVQGQEGSHLPFVSGGAEKGYR